MVGRFTDGIDMKAGSHLAPRFHNAANLYRPVLANSIKIELARKL